MVEHPWARREVANDVVPAGRVNGECVGACPADQGVIPHAAVEIAVTGALVEIVAASATHQSVGVFAAIEAIAVPAAGEPIRPISAAQSISALIAV